MEDVSDISDDVLFPWLKRYESRGRNMTKYTPDNITSLNQDEVFVFGSNEEGYHGGGAAHTAHRQFGAQWGVGEGLTGRCYAFPTLAGPSEGGLRKLAHEKLEQYRDNFFLVAEENRDKTFYLTKVGCGLAGYEEDYMKSFFTNSPGNIIKPEGW